MKWGGGALCSLLLQREEKYLNSYSILNFPFKKI